jgi:uncharacterized membrane protein
MVTLVLVTFFVISLLTNIVRPLVPDIINRANLNQSSRSRIMLWVRIQLFVFCDIEWYACDFRGMRR